MNVWRTIFESLWMSMNVWRATFESLWMSVNVWRANFESLWMSREWLLNLCECLVNVFESLECLLTPLWMSLHLSPMSIYWISGMSSRKILICPSLPNLCEYIFKITLTPPCRSRPVSVTSLSSVRRSARSSSGGQHSSVSGDSDLLMVLGGKGRGLGEFMNPQGVASTARGHILVTDSNNQNVQMFTSSGELICRWGTRGRLPGQLQRPTGIAVTGVS